MRLRIGPRDIPARPAPEGAARRDTGP
jgi:hypothetical protein